MVKEYNKELLKKGILQYETGFHAFNKEKSTATIIVPYPALKELGITQKEDKVLVTIGKIEDN